MSVRPALQGVLDPHCRDFYQRIMRLLDEKGLRFLVGGAYSLARYTGIERHTKDFDIFVHPDEASRTLAALAAGGYETEFTFPHWLGKVREGDNYIDVIFSSGNGVARVDDGWFQHSVAEVVLEHPVRLCPVEETIWSKAFVMERERYDGADVAHLLRSRGPALDWPRLIARFGPHWRVLLSYLVLFGFIYPGDRDAIPAWVIEHLGDRLRVETQNYHQNGSAEFCQGTLCSRAQYLVDVEHWGYRDARLTPAGSMSQSEIDRWTAAIDTEPVYPLVVPIAAPPVSEAKADS